jgi:ABC-type phosphate transport system substrate-binding protein
MVALALCVGALGSFAMAAPAMAAQPGGAACQPTDGKISGRGSTLQGNLMTLYINGYANDVCGVVAAQFAGDPSPVTVGGTAFPSGGMISYNYPSAANAGARGSGEGLAAMACRTDAFGGTDIPYNNGTGTGDGTLPWIWELSASSTSWPFFDPTFGADGSNGCDSFYNKNGTTVTAWTPPYTPAPNAGCAAAGPACFPSTVGGATNSVAHMMSFPVGVAAAALGVNFTGLTGCPTTAAQAQLTASQVSQIFSGTISNWSALGNETSFNWTTCNQAITRIVRGDISGTTQEMKNYLKEVDGARALCNGNTWTTLQSYANNTVWPGDAGHPCAGVTTTTTALGTGGGAGCPTVLPIDTTKGVICALVLTPGGITYGDLSNWAGTVNVMYANVVPPNGGSPPGTGVGPGTSATLGAGNPNCDTSFAGNVPGTGTPSDFVGLNGDPGNPSLNNWGVDGANGSSGTPPDDITNIAGSGKWPICTLTYDMVYRGLSGATGSGAIGGLTDDQRRTLYTFWRYALSPDGQATLGTVLQTHGYLPIPAKWASQERLGFIAGF